MKRLLTIIIFTLIFGFGCSTTKEGYTYEICVRDPGDSSEIVNSKIIDIADTTVAFLSGQVIDKKTKEALGFAPVRFTDTNSENVYDTATDTSGYFSITAPAGKYKLSVLYIGYTTLGEELTIGSGEMREVLIHLGEGAGFVTYEIKSKKKLNQKKLTRMYESMSTEQRN